MRKSLPHSRLKTEDQGHDRLKIEEQGHDRLKTEEQGHEQGTESPQQQQRVQRASFVQLLFARVP